MSIHITASYHLQLSITGEHEASASLGGQTSAIDELQICDGRLQGVFDGNIGTDDASKRDHRISLDFKLRGENLSGAVSAVSTLHETVGGAHGQIRGNFMSYWASLGV